ncbi:hypothetical protein MCOR23_008427 [Pyricularia oryzae]|nr:hypothetical protein MCOR19_009848 [Pyricularia oryzae]KAI6271261.1 hypothetical protein MCOR26_007857 [Pyricularia oryzae]KAI6392557.1 hypothetical protein MCOR23_008427 [Pyricularia oryzae]KAI6492539.1 hypothetical protein MCOR13_007944 [Pyricularia oryzae]KAI6508254.1 hypothetical protein MCOR10_010951 [Pyricularia oryzae]
MSTGEVREYGPDAKPAICGLQTAGDQSDDLLPWRPICHRPCEFGLVHFDYAMVNAVKNPNLLSSWLFRAEILSEIEHDQAEVCPVQGESTLPRCPALQGFRLERAYLRQIIPRNTRRDSPMIQSCTFYVDSAQDPDTGIRRSLVLYLPHLDSTEEFPYYHPRVRGVGLLHEWNDEQGKGTFSIHYQLFPEGSMTPRLQSTALNMLSILHKLGQGQLNGYVKRVHHDRLVPKSALQDRYSGLRDRYAKELVGGWAESTDPMKHVFEDLCIAAFLIELWAEMYKTLEFPGFVDIGAGNGLLVHILNLEGYRGWGFDARARKSWHVYNGLQADGQPTLQELVLIPSLVGQEVSPAIPCCSHNLTGARFRAPRPTDKSKSHSAYSSLVAWVSDIATDCGWEVESEMLRIPSTRNTAIVGRHRTVDTTEVAIDQVIARYGGSGDYCENAMKLVKSISPRRH